MNIADYLASPNFWFAVLASTTPVMLATLAANIVSKAGIFNLAIEGTMLFCALAGVLASAYTQSLLIGALAGILTGVIVSFALGYFALIMKGAMNACGVAINLAAAGGTVFILSTLTGSKITSSSLVSLTFPGVEIPLIKDIPFIGQVLSGHNLITYLGWLFAFLTWFLLFKTKLGQSIRAVGENEEASRSAGININAMRFITLALCGVFCAFGGMYLSMGSLKSFTAGMVAGRGYLSLAMNTISRGNPLIGFASSLLYGFADTVTVYLQLYSQLDLKLISALPYVFIILILVAVTVINNIIARRKFTRQALQARSAFINS
ncbi:MAG TPA: ABC transporter permease [Feifaniaceae bacterium]|nr:ABC transporter permease [Feifaniaceae bacterium]